MGVCKAEGCDEWVNEAVEKYCSDLCRLYTQLTESQKRVEELEGGVKEIEKTANVIQQYEFSPLGYNSLNKIRLQAKALLEGREGGDDDFLGQSDKD